MLQTKAISVNPIDSSTIEEEEGNFTVVEDGTCILEEEEIKKELEDREEGTEIVESCEIPQCGEENENTFLSEELFDNELITKTFEDEVFVNEVTVEDSGAVVEEVS